MQRKLLLTSVLGVIIAMYMVAQGPLHDKVLVTLPYPVSIKDMVLQPGDYEIRQMSSSGGNNRVLHIFSDQGMKLETTVMTIPALDNKTPEDTKVILHHIGDGYYFDKIWIQGKNYGYEFVLPDSVKSRERERRESASVVARYEPAPEPQKADDEAEKRAKAEADRLEAERLER